MSESSRDRFFQRAMIAAWGFITLVLMVVVFFLVNERAEQRRASVNAAAPIASRTAPPAEPAHRAGENERAVRLYFATAEASGLAPESRAIPYGESTVGNCRAALEALAAGPRDGLTPIMPRMVSVRAVYALDGGRLVVDFSREVAQGLPRSISSEALFVQGVIHTLTQPELRTADGLRVTAVRILIEGFPAANSFASHLDFSDFITPDPAWVHAAQPAA